MNSAEELNDITETFRITGFFCDFFYCYKKAAEDEDINSLFDKNRVDERTDSGYLQKVPCKRRSS